MSDYPQGPDIGPEVLADRLSGREVARYADVAMYLAEPLTEEGEQLAEPTVTLLDMTANPLRLMAAVSELYRGGVYRDPAEITKEQALEWLGSARTSKISAPMEWITFSFLFEGVSRALTHQLVRQRTAVYVQESMRFAVKDNAMMEVLMPHSIASLPEDAPLRVVWNNAVFQAADNYDNLVHNGIPAEDARGLLPTNIATRIHYHTDFRNLVAQSGLRLCSQAQHEWKVLWRHILNAIVEYGSHHERWQQIAIASMFQPICYQTGKCEFMGPADRYCAIRERVEAHHAKGERPETWADIDSRILLRPDVARRER
jgi:flavin-dependent thymidylate synthase